VFVCDIEGGVRPAIGFCTSSVGRKFMPKQISVAVIASTAGSQETHSRMNSLSRVDNLRREYAEDDECGCAVEVKLSRGGAWWKSRRR